MNDSNAEALEREYDEECRKAQEGDNTKVEVLPSMDARGRLYDVGSGGSDDAPAAGNRKKKEKVC
jgi:hypothetical protein